MNRLGVIFGLLVLVSPVAAQADKATFTALMTLFGDPMDWNESGRRFAGDTEECKASVARKEDDSYVADVVFLFGKDRFFTFSENSASTAAMWYGVADERVGENFDLRLVDCANRTMKRIEPEIAREFWQNVEDSFALRTQENIDFHELGAFLRSEYKEMSVTVVDAPNISFDDRYICACASMQSDDFAEVFLENGE